MLALAGILGLALHPLPLVSQMIATTVLGGVLVAGLSQHELGLLSSSPARWVGQRSYGLYLWHPFVAVIFFYQFRLGDGVAMCACVLLVSLFIAHTTHRFVERPLREVGRRLAERVGHAEPESQVRSRLREAAA
jgi:peptidoglycan/LPS O-acetylase OafA/YrhL